MDKMKAISLLIGCGVLMGGCSQAIDYTYSKRNFTSSTFEADLSACKHQRPSVSAFQTLSQEQRAQLDDAAERDCMTNKEYKVETDPL
jgi:PBP1b-binding outer membrane lipoprotein LpoB